jgi:signal transduction histidine kinase
VVFKNFFSQLNLSAQSRKVGISIWQYPQFLFLVMGIITIAAILTTYAIGIKYVSEPEVVVLIVLALSAILLIITFTITQSFERLVEANRMKSEFVSIVSHQLRSPLSNLRWALELLMSGRLGKIEEQQLDYFKILKDNSSRMGELVRDLLIVSRIEQGRIPFKTQEVSLVELIKNLISLLAPFARASNVEIKFESKNNLPKIFSDPSQLKLIIENLLDNAIRYIREKGDVKISLIKKDGRFYFEIKDNGVGIPKEDQKYIFQKFFRSSNVLRHKTQGTGLGLYITKSLIEKMGGKIGFKSEENKGSTFWFTLPIK